MLQDEKVEAKAEKQKLKNKKSAQKTQDFGDLEKMILAKQKNNFNAFIGNLERKYCKDEIKVKEPEADEDGWVD